MYPPITSCNVHATAWSCLALLCIQSSSIKDITFWTYFVSLEDNLIACSHIRSLLSRSNLNMDFPIPATQGLLTL